ncbi:MAG: PAS domain-containing sensor histidine kinase [Oligoflexia bacterium]|nr:PAS domain-containing sensor histidine kinase [Oligoflexia bacterium]
MKFNKNKVSIPNSTKKNNVQSIPTLNKKILDLKKQIKHLKEEKNKINNSSDRRSVLLFKVKERTKELQCMYKIANAIALERNTNLVYDTIAKVIPDGWQFPKKTFCRIIIDDTEYFSKKFKITQYKLSQSIVVGEEKKGRIDIFYDDDQGEDKDIEKNKNNESVLKKSKNVFLDEERELIQGVALVLSSIVKIQKDELEKNALNNQLLHADRLSTIGQLASGVVHELSEPLSNILGFAQLAKKIPNLSSQLENDLIKIEKASLYAREIIKKLMTFAKPTPPQTSILDLNNIVKESIFFFESRCRKEGIELKLLFSNESPKIIGDGTQIKQVITNLVVNAIQAMPSGGVLTIKTQLFSKNILLTVGDTGIGIDQKVIEKIFLPFFTTKDTNGGTGLGLAVVYGIIKAHKGEIKVSSQINNGTVFEIIFPRSE